MIREESEETQDYVCEMLTISPEEARSLPLCRVLRAKRSHLTSATMAVNGGVGGR